MGGNSLDVDSSVSWTFGEDESVDGKVKSVISDSVNLEAGRYSLQCMYHSVCSDNSRI